MRSLDWMEPTGLPNWVIWALPLGAALDAALGDPRGWPHPVRAIGLGISSGERALRAVSRGLGGGAMAGRIAGVALAGAVVALTSLLAWAAVSLCDEIGDTSSLLGRALLIYWGLATRSLGDEALLASEAPDLPTARRELSLIVGRDTAGLDWPEIQRACVETVGENACDGVVAPLVWYAIGGPVGLWAFKAMSTLDSMLGYRDDRYRHLGWASARLDDLACLVPARLTWFLTASTALLLGEWPIASLRIGWRDGRKHPSPNSAWGEAAIAGALGVQLGGMSTYAGISSPKPLLGDLVGPIDAGTVRRAVRLMWFAAGLATALAWTFRVWLLGLA